MTDLNYDASKIFELLPSFWGEFSDKAVLEKIYEGYLRVIDNDYAKLFTLEDQKDLSTLRPTTFQPLAYQELDNWEDLQPTHSHEYFTLPISSESDRVATYRVPGTVLRDKNLVFSGLRFLPTFLYKIRRSWWVTEGTIIRGCELLIDKDKYSRYFEDEVSDLSTNYTIDPCLHQMPLGDIRVVALNPHTIQIHTGDGEADSFTLPDSFDVDSVSPYIEFWDITPGTRVTQEGFDLILTPPTNMTSGARAVLQLSGGSYQEVYLNTTIRVTAPGQTVAALLVHVDYLLTDPIQVSGNTFVTKTPLIAGSDSIIKSQTESFTLNLSKATNQIIAPCRELGPSAALHYLGINLQGVTVQDAVTQETACGTIRRSEPSLLFESGVGARLTFRVEASNDVPHSHEHFEYRGLLLQNQLITLPKTPRSLEGLVASFDGHLLTAGEDYSLVGDDLQVLRTFDTSSVLVVYYETTDIVKHSHSLQKFITRAEGDTELFASAESGANLLLNGSLIQSTTLNYRVGTGVTLLSPAIPYTVYTYLANSSGRKYRHLIPTIQEPEWNYVARLASAEKLSNGIESPTITLGSDQFSLEEENGQLFLYADVKFDEGWWHNAEIDENQLQRIWGDLIGLDGVSDDNYRRVLFAIFSALRAPSSKHTIENYGAILLGSAYTSTSGYSRGITDGLLTIQPDFDRSAYTLPVSGCSETLVDLQGCIQRNQAVNRLVTVHENNLDSLPWLPLVAEGLSESFRAATRLDESKLVRVNSVPYDYNPTTKVLTDFSVDFIESRLFPGSLIRAVLGSRVNSSNQIVGDEVVFTRVVRVLSAHEIEVDIPTETSAGTGYGEDAYGLGAYGGSEGSQVTFPHKYTFWAKRVNRLDTNDYLDRLDPGVTSQLNSIVSAFTFGVQLDWSAMTDTATVESLKLFLDKVKPADAGYFVFTEALTDLCSTPVADTIKYILRDADPTLEGLANTWQMAGSFVGGTELLERNVGTEYLYTGECLNFGTLVTGTLDRPTRLANVGTYYITAAELQLPDLASVYSQQRGLENMLVRVDSVAPTFQNWTVQSNLAPRPARGLKMIANQYITVDSNSSTGNAQVASQPLEYIADTEFTLTMWLNFADAPDANGESRVVLDWGDLFLELESTDTTISPTLRINGNPYPTNIAFALANSGMTLTLTYSTVGGGTFKLFVDDNLRITVSETLASFTDDMFIGIERTLAANTALRGTLLLFDLRKYALSDADVASLWNAGNGVFPPIGTVDGYFPQRFQNAWITYQFHDYWPEPIVVDYSGNAYNGVLSGAVAYGYGDLLTNHAQVGDCHVVTSFETVDGVVSSVPRAGVSIPLLNDGDTQVFNESGSIYGGSGEIDNTLLTLTREGDTFFLPDVAYCLDNSGWQRFLPDVGCPYASVDIDNSDLYLGFTV